MGGESKEGELAILKACCKQSLEEGMVVAKKVHRGGLAGKKVASSANIL